MSCTELKPIACRQVPGGGDQNGVATLAETFWEARVRLHSVIAGALLFIAFASCARAEDGRHGRAPGAPVLTGKERLGPKWTDEQRIDNCNVPVDKRGARPRPSACANNPSS